jgi:hypothetical protein
MFLDLINVKVFMISLSFGLLFVYLSSPTPTIIYVYPTPDNVKDIEYVDIANNCFQFESKELTCPANMKNVKDIPIQN